MERIKTPFGFSSTVDEVLQGIELTGKRAIVTGRPTDFSGGVAPYAIDPSNAERLWDVALKLVS